MMTSEAQDSPTCSQSTSKHNGMVTYLVYACMSLYCSTVIWHVMQCHVHVTSLVIFRDMQSKEAAMDIEPQDSATCSQPANGQIGTFIYM